MKTPTPEERTQISVRVTTAEAARLRTIARKNGRSRSEECAIALRNHIRKEAPNARTRAAV